MQDCVSAHSKALDLNLTKAFSGPYIISKTKVKHNLLLVVIDYFKKVHLERFR